MRFLPCLSQNVSLALTEKGSTTQTLFQSLKDKKRRSNVYQRRPSQNLVRPPSCSSANSENIYPVYENDYASVQDLDCAPDDNLLLSRIIADNFNTSPSTSSTLQPRPHKRGLFSSLPLCPTTTTTHKREIIHVPELSPDYLPSFVIGPPLPEDDHEMDTTSRPSAPERRSFQPDYRLIHDSWGTYGADGCSCDGSQASREPRTSSSETSPSLACGTKSVPFNKAFIKSTSSLPFKTHDSDVARLSTELTNNCKNRPKLKGQKDNFSQNHRNCLRPEPDNTYCTARAESFRKLVIRTPDPYDSLVEEDDKKSEEDTDVDIETVSPSSRASEFLGCMSFGVGHLLKRDLDGWYYLLTEEVGRKKHLQAHNKSRPVLATRNCQNVPEINRAVNGQERIIITIARGKNGFGFSFVDEFPPKVGRVDRASPAEHVGVKKGDMVIKINGKNVSRSTCEGVAHLVKKMNPSTLRLELLRDQHIVSTTTEITATGSQHPHDTSPYNKRGVGTSTDNLYESIEDRSSSDHHKENRAVPRVYGSFEEEYRTDDDLTYSQNSLPRHQRVTSTPRLFVGPGHKAVSAAAPCPLSKHESIHRLMSLELDYIDFMHYGIERYSRPLRHSILSAHHHMTVFQNVEKLVTISEYHIKQMQENNSSINSDTDDSQSSESNMFPNSVALIYHSKIHMLSQAYEDYASGLFKSNTLLRELRRNQDFMHFIKEPDFTDEQCADHPSISAFINRPVLHIQELYSVLSEVFSATPIHSADFANLQQIVIKLSQCVSAITGLSSACRVESLDSLTSSQDKGSMASLSSTCSSSEADVHYQLIPSSAASLRSIDKDVKLIQDKLVFSPKVQAFQLLQEGRHLIYKGEIYRHSKGLWFKSQLILFSDILLLVSEEPDGFLCVTNKPIMVRDLTGIEVNRKYASEFVLYTQETTSTTLPRRQQSSSTRASNERSKAITLRAPSSQEKFMWKSLIEQRVTTFSGSRLQHYGSMRDISHVKTSVIL